jgi:mono/diheme cytochrome c family protein
MHRLRGIVAGLAGIAGVMFASTPAAAGDGAALFAQNCELCHQAGAKGLPGQFPRLAGRVAAISRRAEGRIYLADILTYGLSGTVKVDDQEITGVMPPFAVLPNDVVADILVYVQSLGEASAKGGVTRPFTEQEIGAARAQTGKSMDDVASERRALQHLKIIE